MYRTNKIKMIDRVQSYKPLSNQQSQPLRPTRFFDSCPGMWTVTVVLLCLSTQLDDKSGHHSDVPGRRSITALADFNQKRLTVADIKAMLITLIRPMVGPLQRAWTAMADDIRTGLLAAAFLAFLGVSRLQLEIYYRSTGRSDWSLTCRLIAFPAHRSVYTGRRHSHSAQSKRLYKCRRAACMRTVFQQDILVA